MQKKNESFDNILKKAQDLGYAESNPKFDIDGTDTAQKLSILSSLSFGIDSNIKKIYKDGIQNIDLIDLKYAQSLGFKLKLLGIAEKKKNCISSFVYPCFVNENEIISSVDGVFNAVVVESDFCNQCYFLRGVSGDNKVSALHLYFLRSHLLRLSLVLGVHVEIHRPYKLRYR